MWARASRANTARLALSIELRPTTSSRPSHPDRRGEQRGVARSSRHGCAPGSSQNASGRTPRIAAAAAVREDHPGPSTAHPRCADREHHCAGCRLRASTSPDPGAHLGGDHEERAAGTVRPVGDASTRGSPAAVRSMQQVGDGVWPPARRPPGNPSRTAWIPRKTSGRRPCGPASCCRPAAAVGAAAAPVGAGSSASTADNTPRRASGEPRGPASIVDAVSAPAPCPRHPRR